MSLQVSVVTSSSNPHGSAPPPADAPPDAPAGGSPSAAHGSAAAAGCAPVAAGEAVLGWVAAAGVDAAVGSAADGDAASRVGGVWGTWAPTAGGISRTASSATGSRKAAARINASPHSDRAGRGQPFVWSRESHAWRWPRSTTHATPRRRLRRPGTCRRCSCL